MKPQKSNNQGFTLLEVLIAVMVLAVVIVPMLHSFVSSHRMNSMSKQQMRATALAQNEMEIFEKDTIADLIALTDDTGTAAVYSVNTSGGDPIDPDAEPADGIYVFHKNGVKNNGSDGSTYDITVTLNPERENAGDRYYDTNNKSLFYMNSMGTIDSASYVQAVKTSDLDESGVDEQMYSLIRSNYSGDTTIKDRSLERWAEDIARRITVSIYTEDYGTMDATKVGVKYEYFYDETDPMMSQSYYKEECVVFDNSQTLDADGNPIDLKSVYLFYSPRYLTSSKTITHTVKDQFGNITNTENLFTNRDYIVIENEEKLPVDVYVIRQENYRKDPVPSNYQADLKMIDGMDGGFTFGNYFTNLNLDQPVMVGNGSQITVTLEHSDTHVAYNTHDSIVAAKLKPIGASSDGQSELKDRIYTMTVQIYDAGADQNTDAPLVTLTGSKLE